MTHKNTFIINPKTGTPLFGVMPEIKNKAYYFPEGDIYLRHGEHRGPNRGWGLKHIWAEHKSELLALGHEERKNVADFVSEIIQSKAKIFCEFSQIASERVTVLKSPTGLVILDHRTDGEGTDFYSVVTAFKANRAQGVLIGNLK
jgi:hypothetical protein